MCYPWNVDNNLWKEMLIKDLGHVHNPDPAHLGMIGGFCGYFLAYVQEFLAHYLAIERPGTDLDTADPFEIARLLTRQEVLPPGAMKHPGKGKGKGQGKGYIPEEDPETDWQTALGEDDPMTAQEYLENPPEGARDHTLFGDQPLNVTPVPPEPAGQGGWVSGQLALGEVPMPPGYTPPGYEPHPDPNALV